MVYLITIFKCVTEDIDGSTTLGIKLAYALTCTSHSVWLFFSVKNIYSNTIRCYKKQRLIINKFCMQNT